MLVKMAQAGGFRPPYLSNAFSARNFNELPAADNNSCLPDWLIYLFGIMFEELFANKQIARELFYRHVLTFLRSGRNHCILTLPPQ
jgi:hypothetical protein